MVDHFNIDQSNIDQSNVDQSNVDGYNIGHSDDQFNLDNLANNDVYECHVDDFVDRFAVGDFLDHVNIDDFARHQPTATRFAVRGSDASR